MESNQSARRTEDIALDLLKFVATTANVGGKSSGSTTGFGIPSAAKAEDQVTHLWSFMRSAAPQWKVR
jgi:hypothetical protein